MEYLQIEIEGSEFPKNFPLTKDVVVVGRQPHCDLVLNRRSVSREHARFEKRGATWRVEDLQSRNGVWLNGKRIGSEPVSLKNGDEIGVGEATLRFFVQPERDAESNEAYPDDDSTRQVNVEWGCGDFNQNMIKSEISVVPNSTSSFSADPKSSNLSREELMREIQSLEERVRVLIDFARTLGKAENVLDLTPRFLKSILSLFPTAYSACVLAPRGDEKNGKEVWELVSAASRDGQGAKSLRPSRAIVRHVVKELKAVVSDSPLDDMRFDPSESMVNSGLSAVMAAPIYDAVSNQALGVILVDSRRVGMLFTQDDLRLLVSVANQVAVYWENQHYRDASMKEKLALNEMRVANQVQTSFLPNEPPKIESYDFFDYYLPAKFVGGDYFDYVSLPDDRLAIILGDVSGKGISASLLMAKLSSESKYGLLLEKSYSKTMERLNRVFAENHWGDRFITLVMLILEPKSGTVRIFNAGHLFPLVSKLDGSVEKIGEGYNSLPLGIDPTAEYPEFVYHMREGETISIMSDGFPDAMSGDDVAFGDARVIKALRNENSSSAKTLGERLVSAMRNFCGAEPQTDDQCLVVFKRNARDASNDDERSYRLGDSALNPTTRFERNSE